MKEVIEKIIRELENASHFTEGTYDEDGYSNDDSEEVINLYRATEIVKKVLEEHYIARQDRVNGKIIGNQQCLDKLGRLEDAEEKGLLLRLPCKVGSETYLICSRYTKCSENDQEFDEYSCQGCECLECDSSKEYYIHKNNSVSLEWIVRNIVDFGKTVFLTKEEAEQALKEMEKK